jgi:hypothetical protein
MDYRLSMVLIVGGIVVAIIIMIIYAIYYLLQTPDMPE